MTSARPENRPLLSLVDRGNRHGSRSHMTCFFRCGNACDQPEPNPTDHGHVRDEIAKAVGRRSFLRGGTLTAGALLVGGVVQSGGLAAAATSAPRRPGAPTAAGTLGAATFAPVEPNKLEADLHDGQGLRPQDVVIRWGDPVEKGAPDFDAFAQTVDSARQQFGYNCDYVGLLPLNERRGRVLVVNHEYTRREPHVPHRRLLRRRHQADRDRQRTACPW